MPLTENQQGVLKGMVGGMLFCVALITYGVLVNPLGYSPSMSLTQACSVALAAASVPASFLAISIARMAMHRFFTPEDIDAVGESAGTPRAKELQALLQNTLEQTVLATIAYLLWASQLPATWLSVIPLAALAFACGRILFFTSYHNGARRRAFGFALTFYPTLCMLASVLIRLTANALPF